MKDKYVTAILALIGGVIGLHKLYLKNDLLFVISLTFCWTLIPLFFGIYEAFRFWNMDHHTFNNKFNRLAINIYKET